MHLLINGQPIAMCDSTAGEFEFHVPPGTYTLRLYGTNLRERYVPVVIPEHVATLVVPTINLPAAPLTTLQGHAAPDLAGVVAWRGPVTHLKELRGKVVLLNFWGYWCSPCVHEMPLLFDLYKQYRDKGLMIIGVHRDLGGEVGTAETLDEKDAAYVKELWNGKQIPYPVALIRGHESSTAKSPLKDAAAQYGVDAYPTTIIIDRNGNIAGVLDTTDVKLARSKIETLLGQASTFDARTQQH